MDSLRQLLNKNLEQLVILNQYMFRLFSIMGDVTAAELLGNAPSNDPSCDLVINAVSETRNRTTGLKTAFIGLYSARPNLSPFTVDFFKGSEKVNSLSASGNPLAVVHGLQPGTYQVQVTDKTGCKTLKKNLIVQPNDADLTILNVTQLGDNLAVTLDSGRPALSPYKVVITKDDSEGEKVVELVGHNPNPVIIKPGVQPGWYLIQFTDNAGYSSNTKPFYFAKPDTPTEDLPGTNPFDIALPGNVLIGSLPNDLLGLDDFFNPIGGRTLGLKPKLLSRTHPDFLDIRITGESGNWTINDVATAGLRGGYEWYYIINHQVVRSQTRLQNYSYKSDTPLDIKLNALKVGTPFVIYWTQASAGWGDPNAGYMIDSKANLGGQVSYIFI